MSTPSPPELISTGVAGLDQVLGGGLTPSRLYLAQGEPGVGKTTLALQFLLTGRARGVPTMYITLSETKDELRAVAASHGWSLDGVALFEISAGEDALRSDEQYSVFHPSEIELGQAVQTLLAEVDRVKPKRAVIDSLSEMRLLARDPLRYRRQILALKQFFIDRECTILLLDDPASKIGEHQFQTLAHGVFQLEQWVPEFGAKRRRLQIVKLRGQAIDGAYHDFIISHGGITLFPRVVAADNRGPALNGLASSGIPELDELLGGGITYGSSALILGASGTGKSTLSSICVEAAAKRGERAAVFLFDERLGTFLHRCSALGIEVETYLEKKAIHVRQIDPAELSPGEFACRVSEAVERDGAKIVVIDSLNGYLNAMPETRFLLTQMHEMLTYLGQHGVITILIVAQHGAVIEGVQAPVDLSYLADSVVWLRYFEHAGQVRKAISVLKNRTGAHEPAIREMQVTARGIRIGRPLSEFQGVLTGVPTYHGATTEMFGGPHDRAG